MAEEFLQHAGPKAGKGSPYLTKCSIKGNLSAYDTIQGSILLPFLFSGHSIS
jgi:hypothetical protein